MFSSKLASVEFALDLKFFVMTLFQMESVNHCLNGQWSMVNGQWLDGQCGFLSWMAMTLFLPLYELFYTNATCDKYQACFCRQRNIIQC